MIYFDWKKILEATNGNVADIITIMRIITYRITPKNYYDKTFKFYEKIKSSVKIYVLANVKSEVQ